MHGICNCRVYKLSVIYISLQPSYHRSRVISIWAIKGFDVLELEHVSLYKGLADLLIGPGDEELVVVIGFLCQPGGEVNGGFQIHSFPGKMNSQQLHTILVQHRVYECCNRICYNKHIKAAILGQQTTVQAHQNVSNRIQSSCALPRANTGIKT